MSRVLWGWAVVIRRKLYDVWAVQPAVGSPWMAQFKPNRTVFWEREKAIEVLLRVQKAFPNERPNLVRVYRVAAPKFVVQWAGPDGQVLHLAVNGRWTGKTHQSVKKYEKKGDAQAVADVLPREGSVLISVVEAA